MAKTWKKLLATLLAASMLMGMASVAFAADEPADPEKPAAVETVEDETDAGVKEETPAEPTEGEDKEEETPAEPVEGEDKEEETPTEPTEGEDKEETPAEPAEGEDEKDEAPAEKPGVEKPEVLETLEEQPVMRRVARIQQTPDVSDAKFAVVVSSRLNNGDTTYVVGTVDEDYNAELVLPDASVNAGNVTIEVSMNDVASLGGGNRSHSITLGTGSTSEGNLWNALNGLGATALADFEGATVNATIKSEGESKAVTYILKGSEFEIGGEEGQRGDKVITGTPNSTEAARAAWQLMVNDQNFSVSEQGSDDSYITVVNGSWLQIGKEKLVFETEDDLTVGKTGVNTGVEEIKAAVKLEDTEDAGLAFCLKEGTALAVGRSVATLAKDVNVTVEGVDAEGLTVLSDLRAAVNGGVDSANDLLAQLIGLMNTAIELVDGADVAVTIEFGEVIEEPVELPKFAVEVSSELKNGQVTKVIGTVDKDYNAKLVLPDASVNAGNVTIKVSMNDVASLGGGNKSHSITLGTGSTSEGNLWNALNGLGATALADFKGATVNATIKDGDASKAVTYTLEGNDFSLEGAEGTRGAKIITGTPNSADSARAAWQLMVNDEHFAVTEQNKDDSYVVIANGSSLQIGKEVLCFEEDCSDDLKVDGADLSVDAIKSAVRVIPADQSAFTFTLKKGTTLAVGQSVAALAKDMVVTVDGLAVENLTVLSDLRAAANGGVESANDLLAKLIGLMNTAIKLVDEADQVNVTIEFLCDHVPAEAVKENEVAATCTVAGSYDEVVYCSECNEELSREAKTIEATGHEYDYANAVWAWAEDNSSATLTATCKRDDEHKETKTATVTNAVTTPAQVGVAGVRTYTATVTVDEVTYTDTKTATIPALSGGGGGGSARPNTPATPEENLGENDTPLTEKPFLFEDVAETDWFYEAVKNVFDQGLMEGASATKFDPYTDTTRGMVALILYRMEGSPSVADLKVEIPDLKAGDWYHDAAIWAYANGVYTGFEDGTFGGDVIVTREQLVTVLYRFAQKKGYDVTAANDLSIFVDKDLIGTWAEYAMRWAVGVGLIQGRSETEVVPQGSTMRVELATVLDRFVKKYTPAEKAQ